MQWQAAANNRKQRSQTRTSYSEDKITTRITQIIKYEYALKQNADFNLLVSSAVNDLKKIAGASTVLMNDYLYLLC